MGVVYELPGQALGRHLPYLDVRMEQEQPQQFAAGVPGRAGDRDPDHGVGPGSNSAPHPGHCAIRVLPCVLTSFSHRFAHSTAAPAGLGNRPHCRPGPR